MLMSFVATWRASPAGKRPARYSDTPSVSRTMWATAGQSEYRALSSSRIRRM
jgi:hypothetical protein